MLRRLRRQAPPHRRPVCSPVSSSFDRTYYARSNPRPFKTSAGGRNRPEIVPHRQKVKVSGIPGDRAAKAEPVGLGQVGSGRQVIRGGRREPACLEEQVGGEHRSAPVSKLLVSFRDAFPEDALDKVLFRRPAPARRCDGRTTADYTEIAAPSPASCGTGRSPPPRCCFRLVFPGSHRNRPACRKISLRKAMLAPNGNSFLFIQRVVSPNEVSRDDVGIPRGEPPGRGRRPATTPRSCPRRDATSGSSKDRRSSWTKFEDATASSSRKQTILPGRPVHAGVSSRWTGPASPRTGTEPAGQLLPGRHPQLARVRSVEPLSTTRTSYTSGGTPS